MDVVVVVVAVVAIVNVGVCAVAGVDMLALGLIIVV